MQTTNFLSASCTGCGARYRLSPSSAGKKMKCKHCSTIFAIPGNDTAHATPSPLAHPAAASARPHDAQHVHHGASLRARPELARPGFRIRPMHILFAVATVVVAWLYMKYQK